MDNLKKLDGIVLSLEEISGGLTTYNENMSKSLETTGEAMDRIYGNLGLQRPSKMEG